MWIILGIIIALIGFGGFYYSLKVMPTSKKSKTIQYLAMTIGFIGGLIAGVSPHKESLKPSVEITTASVGKSITKGEINITDGNGNKLAGYGFDAEEVVTELHKVLDKNTADTLFIILKY